MACREMALDNSILNWWASQGLDPSVQKDPEKRRDYEAIKELFALQEKGRVILAGPDQTWREAMATSNEEKKARLLDAWNRCKSHYCLTVFPINLKNGAYWMNQSRSRKFDQYIAFGNTDEERKDLWVLASVAIAGFTTFVAVDYPLLENDRIRAFVSKQDGIRLYRPSEVVEEIKDS